jgi:PAS domain-containing protein
MLTEPSNPAAPHLPAPTALIWEADPITFQFTYVSRSAEQLIGYSLEDWLTQPTFWSDVIHPEDRWEAIAICREAVAHCEDHEFDYRLIAADRQVVHVRDIVRVVCNGCGNPTALRGAMVRLDQSDHGDSERLHEIAHDLNNVFQAITGHASLALLESSSADLRPSIVAIEGAAKLGSALTTRLMSAASARGRRS